MRLPVLAAIVVLCALRLSLAAQSLRIASPANGTVVHPGDIITVEVEASGGPFKAVLVLPQDPIRWVPAKTGPPFRIQLQIPKQISSGKYSVAVMGGLPAGQPVFSDPVFLDVEQAGRPLSLTTNLDVLNVSIGEESSLQVQARYANGVQADVTNSAMTTFVSQSPDIATVDAHGWVKAVAPGSTNIIIDGIVPVRVTVYPPVRIYPDRATITASETRTFTYRVTVNGVDSQAIWSITPPGAGAITSDGTYAAPRFISSKQTVILTATSLAYPKFSGSATITLLPKVSLPRK
jgi:Bacterial Ig-like domain (group 2)